MSAPAATPDRNKWFTVSRRGPATAAQLFCLPHAGAGASAFRDWARALSGIEVLAVTLPGREARLAEQARIDVAELADAVMAVTNRPYGIYGHSFGARIAFEVTRELRRRGAPLPIRLFVGGANPPDSANGALADASYDTDDGLLARIAALGGLPEYFLADPELCALVLPALRADLSYLDRYHYVPQAPLPVPVTAFAGAADPTVNPLDMLGWARHTGTSYRLITLRGGHFFPHEDEDKVTLFTEIATALAGRSVRSRPRRGEIHLWLADLDTALTHDRSLAEPAWPADGARGRRLRRPADQERHAASLVIRRRLLAGYPPDPGRDGTATGPGDTPQPLHAGGHPELPGTGLTLSSSQSAGRALIAVGLACDGSLGAHIERLTSMPDVAGLCATALTAAERAWVESQPEAGRTPALLRLWTAKKALFKAAGNRDEADPATVGFRCTDPPPWRPLGPCADGFARYAVIPLSLCGAAAGLATAVGRPLLRLDVVRDPEVLV